MAAVAGTRDAALDRAEARDDTVAAAPNGSEVVDVTAGKIGLALGGGVARGWSHIGVIRALGDAGIFPDVIAGTSIGAVVGGCHAAGKLDDIEDFARSLTRRRILGYLDFNLAGTGLISGQRLAESLNQALGTSTIEDMQTAFAAVATEIGTGHEVWLSRGRLVDAVRASYALPGIFKPVKINNRWMFDGALVNPVPISVCRAMGARYVIAVNLNFDLASRGTLSGHFNEQPAAETAAPEPQPVKGKNGVAVRRLLQRQIFGKGDDVPGISTVMVDAFNIVQDRIARSRLAGDPPDAMVTPRLQSIGLFDFQRAAEMIEQGRLAAERVIPDIQAELAARRKHGLIPALDPATNPDPLADASQNTRIT